MALYDGFPSIRLEGDEDRALALIPEAKALLYKLQTFLKASGVETYSMSRRAGDDGYIYVRAAQGQYIIDISVAPRLVDSSYSEPETDEPISTPTLLSGMTVRGFGYEIVRPQERPIMALQSFSPTSTCQRINDLPPGSQLSPRLFVSPHDSLSGLGNPEEPPIYTQYTKLRPSMYSGKMQQVVQTVMGLGRLTAPEIRAMKDSTNAHFLAELQAHGAQVRYDYKFHRTHGITTAADGRLWLVEISMSRGVLAMPLPYYPESQTERFYNKHVAVDDSDMTDVIDLLGGLPTGESFPEDASALSAAIDSGKVLRLLPPEALSDFYDTSPYSQILGWAFSPDGSEAHNTGYYYHESGYQRGIWWQINIRIGATLPDVPVSASAEVRRMGEGYLYSDYNVPPINPRAYLPFKVHQPGFGLVSHSAVPAAPLPSPKCDTVVFVAFINGDLHTVKFYRNPKTDLYDDIDDPRYPGECLYAGSWTVTERRGNRSFPPMMYSNRQDDRRVLHEFIQTTQYDSTDLGFGPPQYGDFILQLQYAHVWRSKYFKNVRTTDVRNQERMVCAVSIPEFAREAYYMGLGEAVGSTSKSVFTQYVSLRDPNQGYTWRCLGGHGEVGLEGNPDVNPLACGGDCSPFITGGKVHAERRVVYTFHAGNGGCKDFADGGPWLTQCMNVEGFPGPPSYPAATNVHSSTGEITSGELRLYMTGIGGHKTLPFSYGYANLWWSPSPNPESGEIHQITAYHNAIGSETIHYMTNYVGYGIKQTEGFYLTPVTANDPVPCFIGVHKP